MLQKIKSRFTKNSIAFYVKALIIAVLLFFFRQQMHGQVQQILQSVRPAKPFEGIPVLAKKSQVIQVSAGFPNNVADFINIGGPGSFITSGKKATGPFALSYEYFLTDNTGIGFTAGYASAARQYDFPLGLAPSFKAKLSALTLAGNFYYHIYTTDKLDTYTKASLGINLWKGYTTKLDGTNKQDLQNIPTPFAYNGQLGMRYFFNPKVGVLGELGYSSLKFSANIGISFNIKPVAQNTGQGK